MMSLAEWNTTPPDVRAPVSVLDRIFAILDAVKESDGSITITDIAARTRLPKSTVSRLVTELTGQRYLERTNRTASTHAAQVGGSKPDDRGRRDSDR